MHLTLCDDELAVELRLPIKPETAEVLRIHQTIVWHDPRHSAHSRESCSRPRYSAGKMASGQSHLRPLEFREAPLGRSDAGRGARH